MPAYARPDEAATPPTRGPHTDKTKVLKHPKRFRAVSQNLCVHRSAKIGTRFYLINYFIECADGDGVVMRLSHLISPNIDEGRPQCPTCGTRMWIARIEPDEPGYDRRTFECPECDRELVEVVNMDKRARASAYPGTLRASHRP
jgi:hypothetical protein